MAEQILLTEEYDVDDREGTFATDEDYDLVVDFDADVYKPSGECLLRFRKGILSPAATRAAWDSLKRIHGLQVTILECFIALEPPMHHPTRSPRHRRPRTSSDNRQ